MMFPMKTTFKKRAYSISLATLLLPAVVLFPYSLAFIIASFFTLIICLLSFKNITHLKRGAIIGILITLIGSLIAVTTFITNHEIPGLLLIVYTAIMPSYTPSFLIFHLIVDLQICMLPLMVALCFLSVLIVNIVYYAFLCEALSRKYLRYVGLGIVLLSYLANIALYYSFYFHWY